MNFQYYYSSIQCHMILGNHSNILICCTPHPHWKVCYELCKVTVEMFIPCDKTSLVTDLLISVLLEAFKEHHKSPNNRKNIWRQTDMPC